MLINIRYYVVYLCVDVSSALGRSSIQARMERGVAAQMSRMAGKVKLWTASSSPPCS